jgi:outer membrane protein assembly factor BamB
LTVASVARKTSRVFVFDPQGAVAASSAELPIQTGVVVFADGPYECAAPIPGPPLVSRDGTMFVFSEIDDAVFALDPSLEVMPGWPFELSTPLVRPFYSQYEISCPSVALPAVGPDSTLYLPLQARDTTIGGSLVAIGPDGPVRPGWPVELRQPGAEFWSVVVGSDGTVYALAIEPEPGDTSSASILAIAPDSTVLWTTTIVEPQSGRPPKASPSS